MMRKSGISHGLVTFLFAALLITFFAGLLMYGGFSIGSSKEYSIFLPDALVGAGTGSYEIIRNSAPSLVNFSYTYDGGAFSSATTGTVCVYKAPQSDSDWDDIDNRKVTCSTKTLSTCGTTSPCEHILTVSDEPVAQDYLIAFTIHSTVGVLNTTREFRVYRTIDSSNMTDIYSKKNSDKIWEEIPTIININVGFIKWLFVAGITTFLWIVIILFFSVIKRVINILIISIRRKKK